MHLYCKHTDSRSERNVQGKDITSKMNVLGTDIMQGGRNVQGTDITSKRNILGTDIMQGKGMYRGQTLQVRGMYRGQTQTTSLQYMCTHK